VAVQVRAMTLVAPQLLVTESRYVTVTAPHPSCAVATPVTFVVVLAGQSRVILVGQIRLGRVVSRTVMVCTQLLLLPQASVAVQVRAITLVPPQLLVTESLYRILTWLQVSCAVATPVALVVVIAGHSRTRSGGQVMDGPVMSRTVIICTQLTLLLQPSVAVQVRAMTLVAPHLFVTASA